MTTRPAEERPSDDQRTKRRSRGWRLGTDGGSMIEYIMLAGILALAAIYGFKQARIRENRTIAMQARIIRTLDPSNPGDVDWRDPIYGDDWKKPVCNEFGVCTVPGQCFAAGTLVATENGLVPIESIREGDLVLSRDEATGFIALKPVTQRFVTRAQPVFDLSIAAADGGETIRTTTGHPFWVTGQGWVPAADLSTSQQLWSPSGEPLHLALPAPSELRYETVYNFEIAEYHTYFVGHHGMWVHNGGPSAAGPPPGCTKIETIGGAKATAKEAGIKLGGSYSQVRSKASQNGIGGQVHHMPAKDNWNTYPPFSENTGPAIWLETEDHKKTASWGSGPDADKYRKEQAAKLAKGDVCGAVMMDINDIKKKFGNKYDSGIKEMLDYLRTQGYDCRK